MPRITLDVVDRGDNSALDGMLSIRGQFRMFERCSGSTAAAFQPLTAEGLSDSRHLIMLPIEG